MITSTTTIVVHPDEPYYFKVVESTDEIRLQSFDDVDENTSTIYFGSVEEMEAVANAMLKLVRIARKS